jgi:hypothetical protein
VPRMAANSNSQIRSGVCDFQNYLT